MSARPTGFEWKQVGPRLTFVLAVIVGLSVLAVSHLAMKAFDRAMAPEIANRTRLIGAIMRDAIQRPLERGIPLDALAGLDGYLTETLARFDEVDRIAIRSAEGAVIAEAERAAPQSLLQRAGFEGAGTRATAHALSILQGQRVAGTIEVQVRPDLLRRRMHDVFLDILVIALVATLIALEFAFGLLLAAVGRPLRHVQRLLAEQRQGRFLHRIRAGGLGALGRLAMRLNDRAEDLGQRLAALPAAARAALPDGLSARIAAGRPVRLRLSDIADIRPALFLLSLSTEIAAAFLPVYARGAARPGWLAPEAAAAAPLVAYLAAIAALSPFGSALVRRCGARRLFIGSMLPIMLALAAMGLAGSVLEITLWRGVIGVFYATATIACQDYAVGAAEEASPSRALGGYLAVVYAGVFSGSVLGGVLAGGFGDAVAFLAAAVLAAAAGLIAAFTMSGTGGAPAAPATGSVPRRRRPPGLRHAALLAGIAMPMHAATAIFVWYLTPLILSAEDFRTADTARVVMLYHLAAILLGPAVARLAERPSAVLPLLLAGGFGSGAALLSLSAWGGPWAMAAAMAGLGIAHTLIRVPQYVVALGIAAAGGPSIGVLRLCERLGAIAGLVAGAWLAQQAGPAESIRILGLVVTAGAAFFALVEALRRSRPA